MEKLYRIKIRKTEFNKDYGNKIRTSNIGHVFEDSGYFIIHLKNSSASEAALGVKEVIDLGTEKVEVSWLQANKGEVIKEIVEMH